MSPQRVAVLRQRASFPSPVAEIAQGPIWDLDVIEAWSSSSWRRSGPGRPSADTIRRLIGDRFEIEPSTLGAGGCADVFRALDRQTDTQVAVKIQRDVQDVDGDALRRFKRELRILNGLSHPNVIPVIAHGDMSVEDEIWYAMPLAQGNLREGIKEIAGNEIEIAAVMGQICLGLSYVHDQGVLHRDLKPDNVLRKDDGTWAISDFGLAREQERLTTTLTATGDGFGTPLYMAPEQWTAVKTVDARADIYSLGKILQHLLTGEKPFIGSDIPDSPLRPIIQRATATQPAQRYGTPGEFMEAINQALAASPEWQSDETISKLLAPRIASSIPDISAIDEFLGWAQRVPEDDYEVVLDVLIGMTEETIAAAWERNSAGFLIIYERFSNYIETASFNFSYCDPIANFCRRAVASAADSQILRATVRALPQLGWGHGRWHVRGVVTKMLQDITSSEQALVALEALQTAGPGAVEWAFEEFAIRTLHPLLRVGIPKIIEANQPNA